MIYHFDQLLLNKIALHSHHPAIFKSLFELVLVSLEEQEWKKSLDTLDLLCQSTIV